MRNIITFRNEEQALLFSRELVGQISDGMWENATPRDHWEVWCSAKVMVGEDVGVNFYARKSNYNFVNPSLLSIIGDRMLRMVNIKKALPKLSDSICEVLGNTFLEDLEKHSKYITSYMEDKVELFSLYSKEEVERAMSSTSYGKKDLMADLRDMKKIINIDKYLGPFGGLLYS